MLLFYYLNVFKMSGDDALNKFAKEKFRMVCKLVNLKTTKFVRCVSLPIFNPSEK